MSRTHHQGIHTVELFRSIGCRGADTWQCSTEHPQCQECRRRRMPCSYSSTAPPSNRSVTKHQHGETCLQADNRLERIFVHLQSQPLDIANEILRQIRLGADTQAVLRFVEYGSLRLQLMLVPDTTYQFTSPYLADMLPLFSRTDNPYLNSKLYRTMIAETQAAHRGLEIEEQLHEAVYHAPYSGARIYDMRISSEPLKPSRWTSISSDDVFLTRLLECYFLYEYPLWPCFHKDHFLDDMTAGRNDYCSPLLVNCILTAACVSVSGGQPFLLFQK
jgi:hypothetical protein